MTYRTFVVRLLMATLCAVCVLAIATLFNGSTEGGNDALSPEQGMSLKAPSFVNVAYASNENAPNADSDFLQQEAGISAYTNVGGAIDLARIEPLFRTIEKQTDDYIVGSMTPDSYSEFPELGEQITVHVYVHREGWIVAYLLQWQEASLIVDWVGYDTKELSSTTLEDTVQRVLTVSGQPSSDISYYDFRYPEASNLMLIADVESRHDTWDSFTVKIPAGFTVYESSWSHAAYDITESECKLNNEIELNQLRSCPECWQLSHGKVDQSQLPINNEFNINLYNSRNPNRHIGTSYCAMALVYREVQE